MHFEQMGVSLHLPGDENGLKSAGRKVNRLVPNGRITKAKMVEWITNAALDDATKIELLNRLKKYPANTMHHFFDNIQEHIARIQSARKKKDDA